MKLKADQNSWHTLEILRCVATCDGNAYLLVDEWHEVRVQFFWGKSHSTSDILRCVFPSSLDPDEIVNEAVSKGSKLNSLIIDALACADDVDLVKNYLFELSEEGLHRTEWTFIEPEHLFEGLDMPIDKSSTRKAIREYVAALADELENEGYNGFKYAFIDKEDCANWLFDLFEKI